MTHNNDIFGGKIALSCSGGGGRAAGFHLGTLSYLDRLNILKDISTLSSVSGGTVTSAKYVLSLKQAPEGEEPHTTFQRFFQEFYDFILNANLVPRALDVLTGDPPRSPSDRRTLVKALAEVYDRDPRYMNGASFGTLFKGREIHLKNIIFNATDCRAGLAFRFQITENNNLIGNSVHAITPEDAGNLRLADVVTASSDIPVGLEPLLFPWDFVWPDDEAFEQAKSHLWKNFPIKSLALMDGGIIDNQGVEGVMLATPPKSSPIMGLGTDLSPQTAETDPTAWDFSSVPDQLDLALFIISDVPLLSDDIYNPAWKRAPATTLEEKLRYTTGQTTLGGIRNILWMIFLLAAVTAGTVTYQAFGVLPMFLNTLENAFAILFVYVIPLTLAVAVAGSLFGLWIQSRRVFEEISSQVPNVWPHLERLRLNDIVHMLRLRLSSTWALTGTIFLNRIRRLMYNLVYTLKLTATDGEIFDSLHVDENLPSGKHIEQSSKTPPLHYRIVPCEIYTLANETPGVPDWLEPTDQIRELAKRASGMGTTLWLNKSQLDDLVACGQLTICFSMLRHFLKLPTWPAPQPYTPYFEQARQDWETLRQNPYAFVPGHGKDDGSS